MMAITVSSAVPAYTLVSLKLGHSYSPLAFNFIGCNYFCDTGPGWIDQVYSDDPVWDSEGCGSQV